MPALEDDELRAALAARERARADYLAAADRLAVAVSHALGRGRTLRDVARELGISRQAVAQMVGRAERREHQGPRACTRQPYPERGVPRASPVDPPAIKTTQRNG